MLSFIENTEWYRSLKNYSHIMIFGAARDAWNTHCNIKNMLGYDCIECFIVSERRDNPYILNGKPVKIFDEIDDEIKKSGLVIISQIYASHKEMEMILYRAGFRNMIPGVTQMSWIQGEEENKYRSSLLGSFVLAEDYLRCNPGQMNLHSKICIYSVTSHRNLHQCSRKYESKYIKYIQAGAKLTEEKVCEITDDTGDNISELNPSFCEVTAGYWIYKNDNENDYVGLYHYGRGINISDTQIESLVAADIDVLLTVPCVARQEIVFSCSVKRAEVIFEAISRVAPEYKNAAEQYFSGKLFFIGNIILAKKEIFNSYYEWMMKVLYECVRIRKERGEEEKREPAYTGEHLLGIFFLHNKEKYKILYAEIKHLF